MTHLARITLALLIMASPAFGQTRGFVRPDVAELCLAAKRGDVTTVERLIKADTPLDNTDSDGQQPIVKAIKGEHHRVLLVLLKNGADPNVRTRNTTGSTALSMAAESGDLRMVESLIKTDADPNLRGRSGGTPLGMASQNGHDDVAAYLLKHGANPNGWASLDRLGRQYTPLFLAADNRHPKIVKLLLEHGARIDQKLSNGDPAIAIAAAKAGKKALAELVAGGAKINDPTPNGATPLIIAIEHSNREAVRFLLENGADPTVTVATYKGKPCTAHAYAKSKNNRQIIAMVEQVVAHLSK